MSVKEITKVDYSAKCLQPTHEQVIEEFRDCLKATPDLIRQYMGNDTRTCVVCGEVKPIRDFGDGLQVPKTTCLECYQRAHKKPQTTQRLADLVTEALKEGN